MNDYNKDVSIDTYDLKDKDDNYIEEKRDESINEEETTKFGILDSIKGFVYRYWSIIVSIIVICCLGWIFWSIYSDNRKEPVNSEPVDRTIEELRGEISDLKQQLSRVSEKADRVRETNTIIKEYNTAIESSQRQTSQELGKARESLQSASERSQSIESRNKEAESRLVEMQNVLGEFRSEQQQFDRIVNEAIGADSEAGK